MRKTVALTVFLLLALAFAYPALAAPNHKAVFVVGQWSYAVDGQPREMDAAPFIEYGRTYVPVRYLGYALGVAEDDIGWVGETGTVSLKLGGTLVQMSVGSKTLFVDGQPREMDVAPLVKNGRTYLPARFVAEAFGYEVGWDESSRAVLVGPKGNLPESVGTGYRLVVHKDYPYGSGPGDFGLDPVAGGTTHGGFSAGGPEGNLYVLDLINHNVKILQKTDATLLKVIDVPRALPNPEMPTEITDLAVDENGIIYMLVIDADGTMRVVALNDNGELLCVYPIPEEIVERPPVHGLDKLVKTREGQVALWLPEKGRFYSFKDGRFMKHSYRFQMKGEKAFEISRLEGNSVAWTGRYGSERTIASAGFVGEDGLGNVWVQVEEALPVKGVELGVVRFSKEGHDFLFFPENDYYWYASRLLNIGWDGAVYQVIPAEKFLKVRVWALR